MYPGSHARARSLTGHAVPLRPHKPGEIWIECTFPCGPPRPIRRGKPRSHPSIPGVGQGRGAGAGDLANPCPHRREIKQKRKITNSIKPKLLGGTDQLSCTTYIVCCCFTRKKKACCCLAGCIHVFFCGVYTCVLWVLSYSLGSFVGYV